jgi:hypothetical protein
MNGTAISERWTRRICWILPIAIAMGNPVYAQSAGTPSSTTAISKGEPRPAYLSRGDEVERRYQSHRANLQKFHDSFSAVLDSVAPELQTKLIPPADVAFGYQILPTIFPDPSETKQTRIRLSPFSWSRTDSVITREADSLVLLDTRVDKARPLPLDDRKREYSAIAGEYVRLVAGQKFIANLIQYNRLWQGEIARLPAAYAESKRYQSVAMERQRILDSLSTSKGADTRINFRLDSLSRIIDSAVHKAATPAYVRVDHTSAHDWIVTVPMYTDINDSAYVERFRSAVENGWQTTDGSEQYSMKLDIRRIAPEKLYPAGDVPANGSHIDIAKHIDRFPSDGAVITTGANSTYVFGRAILLGPHALNRKTLVHEFGHLLGFKDDYFRSYEDSGPDGYRVLEVILPPDAVLSVPEDGKATRQHFEAIIEDRK